MASSWLEAGPHLGSFISVHWYTRRSSSVFLPCACASTTHWDDDSGPSSFLGWTQPL
ncbi:hypothetical protein OH76DRAFT_1554878 [Lentinus brumalis]|uniref:Uncharacterized protein n=1 Tax=Lentinus brumalis TaxID=2498619 RepID=A0A371DG42_9APHY|nr:hypothetical protein OH76DRAFT_1554878 [Polyporus brumalis]